MFFYLCKIKAFKKILLGLVFFLLGLVFVEHISIFMYTILGHTQLYDYFLFYSLRGSMNKKNNSACIVFYGFSVQLIKNTTIPIIYIFFLNMFT